MLRYFLATALIASFCPAIAGSEPLEQMLENAKAVEVERSKFLARFGIDGPDKDAKLIVARKRALRFAVIDAACESHMSPEGYRHCVEQAEKAAIQLGENLEEPDANMLRLMELYGFKP